MFFRIPSSGSGAPTLCLPQDSNSAHAQDSTSAPVLSATTPVRLQQGQTSDPHSPAWPWDPLSQAHILAWSWLVLREVLRLGWQDMGQTQRTPVGSCLPTWWPKGWTFGVGLQSFSAPAVLKWKDTFCSFQKWSQIEHSAIVSVWHLISPVFSVGKWAGLSTVLSLFQLAVELETWSVWITCALIVHMLCQTDTYRDFFEIGWGRRRACNPL